MSKKVELTNELRAQLDSVTDQLRELEEHLPALSLERQLDLLEAASDLLGALLREPARGDAVDEADAP